MEHMEKSFYDAINPDENNPDYGLIVLHLAYFLQGKHWQLIWGMAELIPYELSDDFWDSAVIDEDLGYGYRFTRIVIEIDTISEIFDDLRGHGYIEISVAGNQRFIYLVSQSGLCSMEPSGNSFSTQRTNQEYFTPFVANHWSAVRTKHFKTNDTGALEEALKTEGILKRYADCIGWNFNEYPELLGSFWFVLPNPLYRYVSTRLKVDDDGKESVVLAAISRSNKCLNSLSIKCIEKRDFGLTTDNATAFRNNIAIIPLNSSCESIAITTECSSRGLIDYQPFESFIKTVKVNTSLLKCKWNVKVKEKEINNIEYCENFVYEKVSGVKLPECNQSKPIDLSVKFNHRKKQQKKNALAMGQKLFTKNSKRTAAEYIRSIISKAKKRIIIVDPYFATEELIKYSFAIQSTEIEITILTSKIHMDKIVDKNTGRTRLDLLNCFLSSPQYVNLKKNIGVDSLNILLTPKIEIHDRFLIIDDDVYFSGNSLNNIGVKMSMIIKLPNPNEVLDCLKSYLYSNNVVKING